MKKWIGEKFGDAKDAIGGIGSDVAHTFSNARLDAESRALARGERSWIPKVFRKAGKSTVEGAGSVVGDFGGTVDGVFGKGGKVLKIAALGAVLAGGLAYIASAGRKTVTEADVADAPLQPEDIGAMTPTVPEEAVLPPMGMEGIDVAQAESTKWRDTVRGEGPEQLNPTGFATQNFQDVVTRESDTSSPNLAV